MEVINSSSRLCQQAISVWRKTLPLASLCPCKCRPQVSRVWSAGVATRWWRESWNLLQNKYCPQWVATHLNPHLIPNVKCTLSPLLAFLNKCPPPSDWQSEGERLQGEMDVCECVCVCVYVEFGFHFHKPFLSQQPPSIGGKPRTECEHKQLMVTKIVGFFSLSLLI